MNSRNKFRAFVIFTNSGYLLYALLYFLLYDERFDAAYEKLPVGIIDEYFANTAILIIVLAALIVFWLLSVIGLLLFKNWGRILAVLGLIIGLPLGSLFGPSIVAGWESVMGALLDTCYGITLAVIYLQPISAEFNKPHQQQKADNNGL